MDSFILGSYQICGVFWDRLVVDSRLGGNGGLGSVLIRVAVLVQDKFHQIVNPLLNIVRDREEDFRELFVESYEVSVGWLPQKGFKYIEPCCKQRLVLFRIHGVERGRGVGRKSEAITQVWGLSQDHWA